MNIIIFRIGQLCPKNKNKKKGGTKHVTSDHHLTRTDRKELEGYIEDLQDTVRVLQSQINNLVQRTPRRNENGPVKPIGKEPLPTWEEILQTARIRVKRRTTNEG